MGLFQLHKRIAPHAWKSPLGRRDASAPILHQRQPCLAQPIRAAKRRWVKTAGDERRRREFDSLPASFGLRLQAPYYLGCFFVVRFDNMGIDVEGRLDVGMPKSVLNGLYIAVTADK